MIRRPVIEQAPIERGDAPDALDRISRAGQAGAVSKRILLLTVDLEDYRRQELRDHLRSDEPPYPREVTAQTLMLLELLESCQARATFFCVGRLANELSAVVWDQIRRRHEVGCHGHEHLRVDRQGPQRFREDLVAAKSALEDRLQEPVISFRAPYFSSDGCDPWFGRILAEVGFQIEASKRIRRGAPGFRGTMPLPGSDGRVTSIPFMSIGVGSKRLTVIGGTYFRLLPFRAIYSLMLTAERRSFIPMVYLHPYDLDVFATPLGYPPGYLRERAGEQIRRMGRSTVEGKLQRLGQIFRFEAVGAALS